MEEHSGDMVLLGCKNMPKNTRCVNCLLYYAHQELLDNINNWRAATAGTTDSSTTSGNASGSVCPKGWTLPSGGSDKDYDQLLNRYYIESNSIGSSKLRSAPFSFAYTGYYAYYNGDLSNTTTYGDYQSRTGTNSSGMYILHLSPSDASATYSHYLGRGNGFALRCVAR